MLAHGQRQLLDNRYAHFYKLRRSFCRAVLSGAIATEERPLLAKVHKYRGLACMLTDGETAKRIWDFTEDLEKQAEQMARMLHAERIRTRAHQL